MWILLVATWGLDLLSHRAAALAAALAATAVAVGLSPTPARLVWCAWLAHSYLFYVPRAYLDPWAAIAAHACVGAALGLRLLPGRMALAACVLAPSDHGNAFEMGAQVAMVKVFLMCCLPEEAWALRAWALVCHEALWTLLPWIAWPWIRRALHGPGVADEAAVARAEREQPELVALGQLEDEAVVAEAREPELLERADEVVGAHGLAGQHQRVEADPGLAHQRQLPKRRGERVPLEDGAQHAGLGLAGLVELEQIVHRSTRRGGYL